MSDLSRDFATNIPGVTFKDVSATSGKAHSEGRANTEIDTITPHCTAGLMSDDAIKTFYQDKDYSPNYSIGETGTIFGHVSEKNRSWCTGSSFNDNRAITIECDSEMSGECYMPAAVIDSLKKLCINICQYYKKNKLICDYSMGDNPSNVSSGGVVVKKLTYNNYDSNAMYLTFHRWFSNKSCPGDYFYKKAEAFAAEVTAALNGSSVEDTTRVTTETTKAFSDGKIVLNIKNTIDTTKLNNLIAEAKKTTTTEARKEEILDELINTFKMERTAAMACVNQFSEIVVNTPKKAEETAETWVTRLFSQFVPVEESSSLLLDKTNTSSSTSSGITKMYTQFSEVTSNTINAIEEKAKTVAQGMESAEVAAEEYAPGFVRKVIQAYLGDDEKQAGSVILEGYYTPLISAALEDLSKGDQLYEAVTKTYYVITPLKETLLEDLSNDYYNTLTHNNIISSALQKGLFSQNSPEAKIYFDNVPDDPTQYTSAISMFQHTSYPSAKAFALLPNTFKATGADGTSKDVTVDELYSYGDYIGYKYTPLTYSGEDFIGRPGESVVTILDKVKKKFSLYEYFYDVNGIFHFQKKKTYVETAYGINDKEANEEEYICTFDDKNDIISVTHSTNLDNVKNDYSIWGTTSGDKPVKFHVRVGLNKRPTSYITYNGMIYTDEHVDYREIIFQMAKDYAANHEKNDFLATIETNNPWAKGGKTGFESFYTDVREFWPQMYWGETTGNKIKTLEDFSNYYSNFYHQGEYANWATSVPERVDLIFWFEIIESDPQYWISNIGDRMKSEDSSDVTAVDYREIPNIVWLPQEDVKVSSLYAQYLTKLDTYQKEYEKWQSGADNAETLAVCLEAVDTYANAAMESREGLRKYLQEYLNGAPLFTKPDGTKLTDAEYKELPTREQTIGNSYLVQYIAPELLEKDFTPCKKGTSALDKVEEYLYSYTNFSETKTIQIVPNYDLEVNKKILYLGEPYIIQKITVPLSYNGTMSLTLSKVYEI